MPKQKALSVRQPWAWLIVHGYKTIENRSRYTTHRGRLLIHAGAKMTRADYDAAKLFCDSIGFDATRLPAFEEFPLGGIVGAVNVVSCCRMSTDPWFTGPYGWCLSMPEIQRFTPCKGSLGFFYVEATR